MLGWKEGSQITIEEYWADGRLDLLQALATKIAARPPVLILGSGLRAARTIKKVAPNIPVVLVTESDPVPSGLVASLARPGGNVTGVAGFNIELSGKLLELLLEAAPRLQRVGFLVDKTGTSLTAASARRSVAQYKVDARFAEASNIEEIDQGLARLVADGAQALVVLPGALLRSEWRRILRFALRQYWPVVAGQREFVEGGALLSYSADYAESHRRAAYYVDRILKGTKPADLPIEQPTTFELVVNLEAAKARGLVMPPEIMVRATRIIP